MRTILVFAVFVFSSAPAAAQSGGDGIDAKLAEVSRLSHAYFSCLMDSARRKVTEGVGADITKTARVECRDKYGELRSQLASALDDKSEAERQARRIRSKAIRSLAIVYTTAAAVIERESRR
ncbi:MAG: hypothetical protein ABL962_13715 [Fimbriimonadaceae bacterium]